MLVRMCVVVKLWRQRVVPQLFLWVLFGAPGLTEVLIEHVLDIFPMEGHNVWRVDVAKTSDAEVLNSRRQHVLSSIG